MHVDGLSYIFILFWYVLPAPLALNRHKLAVLGVEVHITLIHALSTVRIRTLYYGILALFQMGLRVKYEIKHCHH